MDDRICALAERIWRYHQLNHQLTSADAILVLCSHDKAVAERGAQLLFAVVHQKPYIKRRSYATFRNRDFESRLGRLHL